MEINYIDIGRRIRRERKRQNLSQQSLAELANLSPTNISHIERGATKLSLPTLVSISNALAVTPNDLLSDSIEECHDILLEELSELLKCCRPRNMKIIVEIVRTAVNALEKYQSDNNAL